MKRTRKTDPVNTPLSMYLFVPLSHSCALSHIVPANICSDRKPSGTAHNWITVL